MNFKCPFKQIENAVISKIALDAKKNTNPAEKKQRRYFSKTKYKLVVLKNISYKFYKIYF